MNEKAQLLLDFFDRLKRPPGPLFCLAARGPEAPGPAKRRRPPGRLGDAGPQAIGIAPGKWPLSLARSLVPLYNNLVFIYFAFP